MRLMSDNEIAALTGYKRPAAQARWLKDNKIRHWINGRGKVIVPDSALSPAANEQHQTPNFRAIA